jgi:hypothetical protein
MRVFFRTIFLVAAGAALLGCSTTQVSQSRWREQFLIAHGFHREERETFTRHYDSLREASRHIGFSLPSGFTPSSGPRDGPDTRVYDLNSWGFVVTADDSRTLDDLSTPCTVGTALVQVPPGKEMPKGFR